MEVSEQVNHEDDSRFFAVHDDVSPEELTAHEPSPVPDEADRSEPTPEDQEDGE